jgi:hypothetical protein
METIIRSLLRANLMPSGRLCVVQIATLKFSGLRLKFREKLSVALDVQLVVPATVITHFIARSIFQV